MLTVNSSNFFFLWFLQKLKVSNLAWPSSVLTGDKCPLVPRFIPNIHPPPSPFPSLPLPLPPPSPTWWFGKIVVKSWGWKALELLQNTESPPKLPSSCWDSFLFFLSALLAFRLVFLSCVMKKKNTTSTTTHTHRHTAPGCYQTAPHGSIYTTLKEHLPLRLQAFKSSTGKVPDQPTHLHADCRLIHLPPPSSQPTLNRYTAPQLCEGLWGASHHTCVLWFIE